LSKFIIVILSPVHWAVDFYGKPQFMAVEIHDKSFNHMLAPELQASEVPVSKSSPYRNFFRSGFFPESPGE